MSNRLLYGPSSVVRAAPLRAFKSEEQAFRAGAWFLAINGHEKAARWCRDNGIAVFRTNNEGNNTAGGFVVPHELLRTIIAMREVRGVFRASARVLPISSDVASAATRVGGLTAYFTTTEGTAATQSDSSWGQANFTAHKLATLSRVSSELDEDAAI